MSCSHRVSLVLPTSLVVAFVALHLCLDPSDLCGLSGRPEASSSHAAHADLSHLGVALAASVAGSPITVGSSRLSSRRASLPLDLFLAARQPGPVGAA